MSKPSRTKMMTTAAVAGAVFIVCFILAFAQQNMGFGIAGVVISLGILAVPTVGTMAPEPEPEAAPAAAPQQP